MEFKVHINTLTTRISEQDVEIKDLKEEITKYRLQMETSNSDLCEKITLQENENK